MLIDRHCIEGRKQPEKDIPEPAVALLRNTDSLTIGADYRDSFTFQAIARCGTKAAAAKVVEAAHQLLALA